jgi:hypothetical protein
VSTDHQHRQADQVPTLRHRGGLAATRSGHQDAERSFLCRVYQRTERGLWVPAGWYALERTPGGRGRHVRLGLYCRRRERQRVVDVAQTPLSGGMSVRQAADSFHVPTFTLKTWLKEAGIRIEQAAGEREAARITVATAAASTGERPTSWTTWIGCVPNRVSHCCAHS